MKDKDIISFETAKLISKCGYPGFNSNNSYVENKDTNRETYYPKLELYEAQKWIRNIYNIHVTVGNSAIGYWWELSKADNGMFIADYNDSGPNDGGRWDDYESALDSALLVALTYIDSKTNKRKKK